MKSQTFRSRTVRPDEPVRRHDLLADMSSLTVTSSAIGGVLSVGMLIIVWGALPVVHPFLVSALIVGGAIGFVLWLRHR